MLAKMPFAELSIFFSCWLGTHVHRSYRDWGVHLKAGNSDYKNTWVEILKAKLGRNTIFDGN